MPHHECLGAECPYCAPLPVGRITFGPPLDEVTRRAAALERLRQKYPGVFTGTPQRMTPQYVFTGTITRPALHPTALRPEEMRQQQALSTFRDSRGQAVPQWPSAVVPSATPIIVLGDHWQEGPPWDIVLHKRTDNGFWGLPGGRQEVGESIYACLLREAKEETGLDIYVHRLVSVDSDPQSGAICLYPDGGVMQYTNLTFLCGIVAGTLACSEESEYVLWGNTAHLPEPFLPIHRKRLELAMRLSERVEVR